MANEHPIPLEALDGKAGILGITGSGKTFTAIGIVERWLELGRQVIIVDPTGAYHGLRTVFPIPIFGGPQGDMPITDTDGEAVARAIVDMGLSAIIDVSLLLKESHAAARRFMAGFVATLKNTPAAARYVVIDEADEFMPENATGSAAGLMGDLKWMVRRGRKDGWRVLMVTQRPQDIAKSVLTQCETLIVHKLVAPQDRKAFQDWVKGNAEAAEAKRVLDSMATLPTGEAWVWSPSHDILERVKMPPNQAADSSKTPEAGDALPSAANFQPVDVDRLREIFGAPAPRADESEEIASLRTEIAGLQRKNVEMAEINRRLAGRVQAYADFGRLIRISADNLSIEIARGLEKIASGGSQSPVEAPDRGIAELSPCSADPEPRRALPASISAQPGSESAPVAPISPKSAPERPENGEIARLLAETGVLEPPKGRARAVLAVLAGLMGPTADRSATEKAWAFMAGIDRKSSTWRGHKAALRGFFEESGGRYRLSTAGHEVFAGETDMQGFEIGEGLVREWSRRVKPAAAGKILLELLAVYPHTLTRAQLAAATNTAMSSSTFRGYLAPLNTLELIEKSGQDYRLAQDLMEW